MITKDMTILDIVDKYPDAVQVFYNYDEEYGTCICCNHLFETLEQVSDTHGIDLTELLRDLNNSIPLLH